MSSVCINYALIYSLFSCLLFRVSMCESIYKGALVDFDSLNFNPEIKLKDNHPP